MTGLADALDLSLEVGELVQLSGGHTTRTVDHMERMAAALGAQESNARISSVNVAMTVSADGQQLTSGRHARHLGINFTTLTQIKRLVADTEAHGLSASQVRARLTLIRNTGPVYPAWLVMLALGGSTAAFAALFHAGAIAMGLALLGGWAGAWVRHLLAGRGLQPFVFVSAAAFTSALIVAGGGHLLGLPEVGHDPGSGGLDPVPGPRSPPAQRDRRPAHRPLPQRRGEARHERSHHRLRRRRAHGGCRPRGGAAMTWAQSLWAGVAVLGFAMVFAVPRRTLPGIVALAIVAHLVRSLGLDLGAALPLASFGAALLVGFTAAVVAPRANEATPIYAFAPVIPLIPGTYMFDALTGMLELTSGSEPNPSAIVDAAVINGSIATLTVIALAVGAITPTLLVGRHLARLVSSGPSEGE